MGSPLNTRLNTKVRRPRASASNKPAAGAAERAAKSPVKKSAAHKHGNKAAATRAKKTVSQREQNAIGHEMARYADAAIALEPRELRWWVGMEALVIGGRKGLDRMSRATHYSISDIEGIIRELRSVVRQKGKSGDFRASIREVRELRKARQERWGAYF